MEIRAACNATVTDDASQTAKSSFNRASEQALQETPLWKKILLIIIAVLVIRFIVTAFVQNQIVHDLSNQSMTEPARP